ncbi:hypothetical protein [Candidatus Ruminimicrobium bovinum]|uniref:hypothetical protein n=1 Tax=Candidatus Ruminimicrobium bovinum TaxID=3242779 RepID=UPI0039B94382
MSNNILISTSMLSSIWEKKRKDTIDLLLPFLSYIIAKNTVIEKAIDINLITENFKREFGYNDIPRNVISQMLTRLTKEKTLKRKDKNFFLIKDLSNFVKNFDKQKTESKKETQIVIESLGKFFEENYKKINTDILEKELVSFFAKKGTTIFKNIDILELDVAKGNEFNYFIGQFILKESKNKTYIFDYLIKMLEGFFISTVIFLQSENNNILKSKFKNVTFYLDTRLILNLLRCHSVEEKEAILELITILKNNGAKICCFEHNIKEAKAVLSQYKNSISTGNISETTLDGLDEQKYSPDDVDRIFLNIAEKIKNLDIDIVESPNYDNIKQEYLIDETKLEDYLKINRNVRDYANKIDVQSISAIFRLRNGVKSNLIENSKAIFVTTSKRLTILINKNKDLEHIFSNSFFPIITDIDLSAIVWIKNFSINKDYPKLKLIENARLSVEPSSDLLNKFFNKLEKIKNEGNISDDEAFILRTDIYAKRISLMEKIHGNENNLTDETIYSIKEEVLKRYTGKKINEKAQEIYNEIELEKNKKIKTIAEDIKSKGTTSYFKRKKFLNLLKKIVYFITLALFIYCTINVIINAKINTYEIILALIAIFEFIDFINPKLKYIDKFIEKICQRKRNKIEDEERRHYKNLFPEYFDD